MRLKDQCKKVLFGGTNVTQWVPVGIEGEAQITVTLHGLDAPRDVTRNCVVAALRPLTLGIALEPERDLASLQKSQLFLEFNEGELKQRPLGRINLRVTDVLALGARPLALFAPSGYRNDCLPGPQLWSRHLFQRYRTWRSRKKRDPFNFEIAGMELESLFIFYIRPRPVMLVTVMHGESSNIFPMDLIGPTDTGYFTLALRSTSPAVELIKASRRIALSGVPAAQVSVAYELGKHHKKASINWDDLPMSMPMMRSMAFQLPVPRFALNVREMHIEHVHTVGSHTLFAAKSIGEHNWAEGARLFHVPGYFLDYRQRVGRPLQSAWAAA